jgi:hypothetical protein
MRWIRPSGATSAKSTPSNSTSSPLRISQAQRRPAPFVSTPLANSIV